VRFEPQAWSADAARGLAGALGDDEDAIRAQVEAGEARLWAAPLSKSWLITRREGSELVIVCYAGRGARAAFRMIYEGAKLDGVKSIRFHTQGPWLLDLLTDWKPQVEYVARFKVE
jgi:hypothetical protein